VAISTNKLSFVHTSGLVQFSMALAYCEDKRKCYNTLFSCSTHFNSLFLTLRDKHELSCAVFSDNITYSYVSH